MDRLSVMEGLEAANVRNAISEAQGEEQRVGQVAWGMQWGRWETVWVQDEKPV